MNEQLNNEMQKYEHWSPDKENHNHPTNRRDLERHQQVYREELEASLKQIPSKAEKLAFLDQKSQLLDQEYDEVHNQFMSLDDKYPEETDQQKKADESKKLMDQLKFISAEDKAISALRKDIETLPNEDTDNEPANQTPEQTDVLKDDEALTDKPENAVATAKGATAEKKESVEHQKPANPEVAKKAEELFNFTKKSQKWAEDVLNFVRRIESTIRDLPLRDPIRMPLERFMDGNLAHLKPALGNVFHQNELLANATRALENTEQGDIRTINERLNQIKLDWRQVERTANEALEELIIILDSIERYHGDRFDRDHPIFRNGRIFVQMQGELAAFNHTIQAL